MAYFYDVFWDQKADKALDEIHDYYSINYSKRTADKIRGEIIDKVEVLIEHPEIYPLEPLLKDIPEI